MTKLVLVVDESGAKGYSNQQEKQFGETGVMAGFLYQEEEQTSHEQGLNSIRAKYVTDGKLHITDLSSEQKQKLRGDIIQYLVENEIICIFEAIYAEGFYQIAQERLEQLNIIKAKRRSSVKVSSNEKKELLHAQLFQGIFGKGVAYGLDYMQEGFSILIRTDYVDDSVLKKLCLSADEFLNAGLPKTTEVTGWDVIKKEVVTGTISSSVLDPNCLIDDLSNIKYDIIREDSAFTLVADVIANSIYRHLTLRSKDDSTSPLNTELSIPSDMQDIIFYGISNADNSPYFGDTIFQHPHKKI